MLTGNALTVYKAKMLRILDDYCGVEAREQQLATDFQIGHNPSSRPDDIRQSLTALKDDGLAKRRVDDVRGVLWSVTSDGHKAAARLAIEEEF